jgi:exo-beta-1,3-glucanase (GH17 family)
MTQSRRDFLKASLALCALSACGKSDEGSDKDETVVPPTPPAETMHAICYSPFRTGQDPTKGIFPTLTEISQDLSLIAGYAPRIRTYGNDNVLYQIPTLCDQKSMKCSPGAWISADTAANSANVNNLISLAGENHSSIESLIVGNEALLNNYVSAATLIGYINQVKQATTIPVGTAETWNNWLNNPLVADASDVLLVHVHPYWEGIAVDDAPAYVLQRLNEVKQAYPGKEVAIGETGWPTQGSTFGSAVPGEANQKSFMTNFVALAKAAGAKYYLFEGFDEKWKEQFGGVVEGSWGLWYADRTEKPVLSAF